MDVKALNKRRIEPTDIATLISRNLGHPCPVFGRAGRALIFDLAQASWTVPSVTSFHEAG
jgi:hypothetical protein